MADMTRSVMRPLLALALILGLLGAEAANARPTKVTVVMKRAATSMKSPRCRPVPTSRVATLMKWAPPSWAMLTKAPLVAALTVMGVQALA